MAGEDHLRELEERYEDYRIYDDAGEKIGKVDDLFVDEADREEYIGVKMGFFGLSSTLIPMEIVRVDERERIMEVSASKDQVKDTPTFDDDDDITPEFEERIRRHFGLESLEASTGRSSYGRYAGTTAGAATTGDDAGTEGRAGGGSYRDREEVGPPGSPMESARAEDETASGGLRDLGTGERDRVKDDEGFREGGGRGGDREDLEPSGTVGGAGPVEEGITQRGAGEPPAGGDMEDEGYREGFREGFREGLRAGSEGGDRGEFADREEPGPSGTPTDAGPTEEGMTRRETGDRDRIRDEGIRDEGFREGGSRDQDAGAARPDDESREPRQRSEGEGEQEESGIARVWRRIRS